MKKTRYTEEQIAFALKQAETGTRVEYQTTSVLQALNQVLGCCLLLSGIRNICAQMGNPHTIASTTDGLEGLYKNQVPIAQVQPVTIFQYSATFKVSIILLLVDILSRYEELTR